MRRWKRLVAVGAGLALAGCAELAPLRLPPPSIIEGLEPGAEKEGLIGRYGPPEAIRQGPEGEILIYRRVVATHKSPNRFYGQLGQDRLEQAELLFLYLDEAGRLVRWEAREDRS